MKGALINIFNHQIQLNNLQIYNEEGFPANVFFDAPEILVDIDPVDLIKGKLHFPLIIFHLNKMIIYRNAQGKLNVDQLKIVQEKLHDKTKGPAPNFKIDELQLNIEQVIVEDDSKAPPMIEAYDLNLKDKTFHDINGVPKLVSLILFEALKPTALQSAGLYAATTLLGIGFLPGLALGVAISNDAAIADLAHSKSQVYTEALALVQRLGMVKNTDAQTGRISAKVNGCDITVEILDQGWGQSKIIIKARKYFIARPEIANGLLYQLKDEIH